MATRLSVICWSKYEQSEVFTRLLEISMKIAVIDDYQDAFRTLPCYPKLDGHEVLVYNDTEKDPARLAERLKDAEAVILTQARSPLPRALIERLPNLRLISQTGRSTGHIDVDACTEHGVVLSAAGFATPHPTAELTWGLILAALRRSRYEVQRLKEGTGNRRLESARENARHLRLWPHRQPGRACGRAFGARCCVGVVKHPWRARAGYEIAGSRNTFFAESDILSLHLPLNSETAVSSRARTSRA
jgi:D-3-phosphoglycerate dehydrogenase